MSLLKLLLLPLIVFGEQLKYDAGGDGISDILIVVDGSEKTDVTNSQYTKFTKNNPDEEVYSLGSYPDFEFTVTLQVPGDYVSMTLNEIFIELQPSACDIENAQITLDGDVLTTNVDQENQGNGITTMSATLGNNGITVIDTAALVFSGDMSSCEPGGWLNYIYVDADYNTYAPSDQPTDLPTDQPTSQPTQTDPEPCGGVVTWGDVHQATYGKPGRQMDEQELGELYYMYPCDYRDKDEFPYRVTATHKRCWWQGQPKSCVDYATVYITTSGDPWIIKVGQQFYAGGGAEITVGTDENYVQSDFDGESLPISFEYDDGSGNSGEVEIYVNSENKVVFTLNVLDDNYGSVEGPPVDCADRMDVEIHIYWSWLFMKCPECYRDEVCGVLGWFTATDCWDPQGKGNVAKCEEELRLWNFTYLPTPHTWWKYTIFARAWNKEDVDDKVDDALGTSKAIGASGLLKKPKLKAIEGLNDPTEEIVKMNRAQEDLDSVTVNDGNIPEYPGVCNDSQAMIDEIDELCSDTIKEYKACCKEIGICDMFENSCTYDMCQCMEFQNQTFCLWTYVGSSLNKTCTEEALYPTGAPTASPTMKPTSFSENLAESEEFVWFAVAFVVFFAVAAAAAYWYYRKKNSKSVYIDNEDENAEMAGMNDTTTQAIQSA